MADFTDNVSDEIKSLNFPLGKYVVVGSAVLAAHNIRAARDIDIVVTPDLYEKCKHDGWETHWHTTGQRYALHKENVEVYLDVNCNPFNPTTAELIERADIIDGIPFISLIDLLQFKRAYGRLKDKPDVKLIERYLAEQKT